jgi:hypothetical protein
MSSKASLEPEVAAFFENEGLVSQVVGNKRKVSSALLTPSPSVPSASSSVSGNSITSASFSATSARKEADSFEIPAIIESKATYEFLGYESDTAQAIWTRYSTKPEDMPSDFFDFARYHLRGAHLCPGVPREECEKFMIDKGVQPWLRQAILMEEFEDLRSTDSCAHWIVDAMDMRYRTLLSMNKRFQERMDLTKKGC